MLAELAKITPVRPNPSAAGFSRVANPSQEFNCGGVVLAFDGTTGAIAKLLQTATGAQWASPNATLASLVYSTFDETGYNAK